MFHETQCPQCHTRFRVTSEQLAKAGGMVRCGGCLTPFQAQVADTDDIPTIHPVDQQVDSADTQTTPPKPTNTVSVYSLIQADTEEEELTDDTIFDNTLLLDWADSLPIPEDINLGKDPATRTITLREDKPASGHKHWLGIASLLVLTLCIQAVIYQMPQLARQPTLRPAYQIACNLFGCTLPAQIDLNQLYHTNLVIRSLPNTPGVLLVDLWLHNKANFNQEFPNLTLFFNNADNHIIAAGEFTPDTYLATDLKAMATLPPRSQVHLSFRISDPGKTISRYQLQLSPPDSV